MKITPKLTRSIVAACRKVARNTHDVDVGLRGRRGADELTANFLIWEDENDLCDTPSVHDLGEVETLDGWAALDCYCFNSKEIFTNVYILISPEGEIVYQSDDDLGHTDAINEIMRAAGHPGFTPGTGA